MKRFGLLTVILFWACMIIGQDIEVTFTGSGEVNFVDRVRATNLTTQKMMVLPGNETLLINRSTGIQEPSLNDNEIKIFPNPLEESSVLSVLQRREGFCQVRIFNSIGQIILSWDNNLSQGIHKWRIKFDQPGIYFVSFLSDNATKTTKVISQQAISEGAVIKYLGTESAIMPLKGTDIQYILNATEEDVIHYECYTSRFVTIITDKPISSKTYNVEFVECTDKDNRTYKVIKKGDIWWMAENLNSTQTQGRRCYNSENSNCLIYGALYSRSGSLDICPEGWHVPSDKEWMEMEMTLGMDSTEVEKFRDATRGENVKAGHQLKSKLIWNPPGGNWSGLNVLPAGQYAFGQGFLDIGKRTAFWTSSVDDSGYDRYNRFISRDGISRHKSMYNHYYSIRCVKNTSNLPVAITIRVDKVYSTSAIVIGRISYRGGSPLSSRGFCFSEQSNPTLDDYYTPNGEDFGVFTGEINNLKDNTKYYVRAYATRDSITVYGEDLVFTTLIDSGTFIDIRDSIEYTWKTIGKRRWMVENLAYLPNINPSSNSSLTEPKYYVYGYQGNSVNEAKASENYQKYGVLYNWEAAKIICPDGWRLPSLSHFLELKNFLGENAGHKMKSTSGWYYEGNQNEGNGNNSSGYNALPAGVKYQIDNDFRWRDTNAAFWSSSGISNPNNPNSASSYELSSSSQDLFMVIRKRDMGSSVRCIKDE